MENVISLLNEEYSGVTYVYFRHANKPDQAERETLVRFLQQRFGISARFLAIPEHSVECALDYLRDLVSSGGFYDFDITGGSSVFIAAAGALWAETGGQNMAIHEYDPAAGAYTFRCPAGLPVKRRTAQRGLTVPEMLMLRGISFLNEKETLYHGADQNDLKQLVYRLWEAVRHDLRVWNTFCTTASDVTYTPSWIGVEKRVTPHEENHCGEILDILNRSGLATNRKERKEDDRVCFSFWLQLSPSAWLLFEKAGNLLEMLTYFTALDSQAVTDCRVGIKLDWDSGRGSRYANPYNELDIVATKGHILWFISCKNTGVGNDYFYEILTMARHFGGVYAVPALVTTAKCSLPLVVRAKEMGIVLIDNIQTMTAKDFCKAMRSAFDSGRG